MNWNALGNTQISLHKVNTHKNTYVKICCRPKILKQMALTATDSTGLVKIHMVTAGWKFAKHSKQKQSMCILRSRPFPNWRV